MKAAEARAAMRSLPFASLADLVGAGRPIIFAPHQDDESLGCGGLIAMSAASGLRPMIVFLTDGSRSHAGSSIVSPASLAALREREARAALRLLGVPSPQDILFLRQPDGAAPTEGDAFDAVVRQVRKLAADIGSAAIFAPWRHDPHCDHVAAHKIAEAVAESFAMRRFSYPIWGWVLDPLCEVGGPVDGNRLDIHEHLPSKRQAIDAHASQRGGIDFGIPDSFQIPPALLAACTQPFEVFLNP